MSGTQSTPPVFETAVAFKTALAKELMAVAKEQAVSSTKTAEVMAYLGLPRPVMTLGVTDFEIPEISEPEMIDGKPHSAYKASWLAEHARKALWEARFNAYHNLRYEIGVRLTEKSVVKILTALGLPVPVTKTTVSVRVKGQPSTVSFTVDGELTEEQKAEIRTHFEPVAVDPMGDAVRALFPEATGLPAKVTVQASPQKIWPEFPVFEEQGEDSSTDA